MILSLAAQDASLTRGAALLAVYALGLGIPFVLVAAFFPRLKGAMAFLKRHMGQIERIMGLLLWTIGLLMLTGGFTALSYWLLETFPALATVG
jgi:cytochrome c-type biogenesis protein